MFLGGAATGRGPGGTRGVELLAYGAGQKTETVKKNSRPCRKRRRHRWKASRRNRRTKAAEPQPAAEQPLVPGKKYTVLVDKSDHKLYLKDGDTVVRTWGCAIGKGGLGQKERRGDNMTPVGTFRVDEIDDASGWTHDFGDGNGEIQGAYGPWFLSLDTEDLSQGNWDGIGIHGTHDPASIGTDASEGCVRLDNGNLRELEKVAYVGMPVTIQD